MWAMATDRVTLVDVADGRFRPLASMTLPGVEAIPDKALAELAATELTDLAETEALARRLFGERPKTRVSNGLYTASDCDDLVYVNAGSTIHAITTGDPNDPGAGLVVARSLDTTTIFEPFGFPGYDPAVRLIGMNVTYDGHLVLASFNQLAVVPRTFDGPAHVYTFRDGQFLSNSFSVDEHGGIYSRPARSYRAAPG
jgi:hypothetical protein